MNRTHPLCKGSTSVIFPGHGRAVPKFGKNRPYFLSWAHIMRTAVLRSGYTKWKDAFQDSWQLSTAHQGPEENKGQNTERTGPHSDHQDAARKACEESLSDRQWHCCQREEPIFHENMFFLGESALESFHIWSLISVFAWRCLMNYFIATGSRIRSAFIFILFHRAFFFFKKNLLLNR